MLVVSSIYIPHNIYSELPKLPYGHLSMLDVESLQTHLERANNHQRMSEAAVKIQSYFRGYKARKFYAKYTENKIRLAIYVQRAWKRHYLNVKKRRQLENSKMAKIIKIQSLMRGCLTRKNWKNSMKKRLANNEQYFDNLRNSVLLHSVVTIQRAWRTAVVNIRKLYAAKNYLSVRKAVVILQKWLKISQKNKKKAKKSIFHGTVNLGLPPKEEFARRSVTNDVSLTKAAKKKRMSTGKFILL